ncbi:multifunctional oxoglutarate decarboxylase/oxoglutarate dehydrogenase thiamine pyrophosphate-binding subunit/dihydrolipoyllysine-residue succinyltransferase subunit [Propionicicella superfundia]|uniref:multifunctional oxoglutarate decarboxylase/oxoglutarate dehydrogenase thiamine pyrophosphate-binding subunit/dihydrolipoyllysine-residue succinyltransferase subunit n=1 Tax=Propionicicella superfundia TaxID=348582 RepID=UPI00055B9B56|nr:multifunctional oxoglutarate decarboxylase/oxoglutarate dehydrogenase thiamine pyrophosphate-binding subunit/dihydrolipoyllysine-residue succinyltransferase subunit [Propionicicella superfundia]
MTALEHSSGAELEFGANEWLIAEMLARYQQDPDSVGPAWAKYFADGSVAESLAAETPAPAAPGGEAAPAAPVTASAAEPVAAPAPATPVGPAAVPAHPKPEPAVILAPAAPATAPPDVQAPPAAPPRPTPVARDAERHPAAPTRATESPTKPQPAQPRPEPAHAVLRGAAMRTAQNMDSSLSMPTATSVRIVPMKLAIEQRTIVNAYLRRSSGGKISFTHLIGYAMVQAIKAIPEMNNSYASIDGKPNVVTPTGINLGIAIDLQKPDGTRQLFVPCIRNAQDMDFAQYWRAYEDIVKRARSGQLTVDDFAGTTVSLTNPGGIGTSHSVPRLMPGQSLILGVGSIEYPPEFAGMSPYRVNELGVSKVTTLTSTYDHRVIQGAQSGEFLRRMHELLIGSEGFYDEIFHSLRVPYNPVRWATDISTHRPDQLSKQARVVELINAYRSLGHLMADIDPLEYRQRTHPELEIEHHGLTLWDLDREFAVGSFGQAKNQTLALRDILSMLRESYCRTMGVEFMHIQDYEQRRWFQERFEKPHVNWTRDEHMRILDKLNEAEVFETFLQTKYVGQKRFSLEGGESAIVALDEICDSAADAGLSEVCIGMPHRGRLNVLANVVGKSYSQIFREFDGVLDPRNSQGTGDVKYHLGAEGEFTALSGATVKTSVAANPSHLEAVDPVLEGIARAKMDRLGVVDEYPVLPVLLHGDAAFAGQGVVYETLQMSQLRAYRTGGTIHVVVNNQVGFTTAPADSRSSVYCTDVAKAIQSPVFHVNGDDPEAVARTARMAFDFREAFHKDVIIDLVCYRRRGHNEGDDPSFTQPLMYNLIEQKRSTRRRYTEQLIGRGDISPADADEVTSRFRDRLEAVFKEVREETDVEFEYHKSPYYPAKRPGAEGTAITPAQMQAVADAHVTFPDGFTVHPKVLQQLERRAKAIQEGPIDWATAELLAFGSLLMEGRPVRLVGQDTRRGTFSQRFAAVIDRKTNEPYVPLKHLSSDQGRFHVFDSLLSEYAAMGFEYGYSVAAPDALVLWEAQFGDFANGAQSISDEFISSGDAKWSQKSGVVLLLPHGFEGQGPDHSSARIERWLQLCSEGALAVCQPSTPASYFHLLRQHAYVNWHRPVVIATPKSMLRNKQAASMPGEFTSGTWLPAIGDPTITDPSKVTRVLLCSGKIRWELVTARAKAERTEDVAIISLERLYPLPTEALAEALAPYRHVTDVRYVQDEPSNQGAWPFLSAALAKPLAEAMGGYQLSMRRISREAASAPSVGSHKLHEIQERELLEAAVVGD